MLKYAMRRLGHALLVLLAVSILVFLLVYLSGDPARALSPIDATKEDVENLRHRLGLDQPLYIQYSRFVQDALHGDLGYSYKYRAPAMSMALQRLPATLMLALASFAITVVVSLPLGIFAASRRDSLFEPLANIFCLLTISTPTFWLGLLLILVFAEYLRWLPASGRGGLQHLVMPAVTLGAYSIGLTTKMVVTTTCAELGRGYVTTARSKGLKEQVVYYRHILKNMLIPVVTVLGLQLGAFLGGTTIVEVVFAWPGIGWLMMQAINSRDLPLIRAIVLIMGVFFTVINLAVDLSYCYLEPRIRYE
jgi:ABC-type dipeptide/oligopeptide/nickel transport system permease component